MPLINLQTNLKSLKFTGAAPYVTKDINNPPVYNTVGHEISARVDDVSRLVKMLVDKPGIEFSAKQALLQTSDPNNFKSEKETILGRAIDNTGSIIKGTARTIGTIIAQAGVNRTGTHFILPSPEYYYTSTSAAGIASQGSEIISDVNNFPVHYRKISRYGYDTSINKAALHTTGSGLDEQSDLYGDSLLEGTTAASTNARYGKTITISTFKDRTTGINVQSLDSRFGFSEAQGDTDVVGEASDGSVLSNDNEYNTYDLVPLVFGRFNTEGEVKLFRGFIGTINDNYQANWAGNQYVGRMEQFFTYTGFSRTLSFNFTVPIFTEAEQPYIYEKVNALISHTAPAYDQSSIPVGVITDLRIGDYIRTPGVLNSVSVSVSNNVPWSEGPGDSGTLLPQVLELQIQFTPIHKETPSFTSLRTVENGGFASRDLSRGASMPYIASGRNIKSYNNPEEALKERQELLLSRQP